MTVINVTKTLATRQQMRATSVFFKGMFDSEEFLLPEEVLYKKDIAEDSTVFNGLKEVMQDMDFLVCEISVQGQAYRNGQLIVIDAIECDQIEVGVIQTILVRNNRPYFICKSYVCNRNYLQYFESGSDDNRIKYVSIYKIADFKPLILRGTLSSFAFVLHHRISINTLKAQETDPS